MPKLTKIRTRDDNTDIKDQSENINKSIIYLHTLHAHYNIDYN